MADVFSKDKRSEVMSLIRSKENKDTELAMILIFKKFKITGWRRNQKVFGKPDFVFPKLKVALFIDGCFWHVCPEHCKFPETNSEFWKKKLNNNKKRDSIVNNTLKEKGWEVIRIWEHNLKNEDIFVKKLYSLLKYKNG